MNFVPILFCPHSLAFLETNHEKLLGNLIYSSNNILPPKRIKKRVTHLNLPAFSDTWIVFVTKQTKTNTQIEKLPYLNKSIWDLGTISITALRSSLANNKITYPNSKGSLL